MALLYNLARVSTATTGTETITLGAAVSGYLTFALAGVTDGQVVSYGIKDGANSETGIGTYTSAGTTLSRTVTKSTNSNNAISLSGTAEVYITARAQDLPNLTIATGYRLFNLSLAVSAAASALTIALKDAAGNDPSADSPAVIDFRNVTLTTGTPSQVVVTAATSLVLSSGSTLGVTSSTAFRLWIVGFNDGGTFRLGAINCSTANAIFPLVECGVASSTAEGGTGTADSAGVIYTGTAVTSKAFRILGFADWTATGLTAGTWTTTALNSIQIFGPGVRMPGAVVQTVRSTTTSNTTTNSTTYQTTNLSAAITPTSAANLIRYAASAITDNSIQNTITDAQMHRGATAIGPINRGYSATGGETIVPNSWVGIDNPNTTSSTTYAVKVKSNGTNNVTFVSGLTAEIIVDEVMG